MSIFQRNQGELRCHTTNTIDTLEMKMRDYVLSEAQSRQAFGPVAVVRRVVRNWKHQRDLRKLLKLDDYLLKDMGMTRRLISHLANQSLLIDLDWEKERVLRMR
jgi:uncharacterized protein YjiS (DUF1127 family)